MGALWVGLGPTALGYLFEGSIKFGVYEALKPGIKNALYRLASATSLAFLNSQILAFILCGTASGLAASIMVCPMEAIRIRMVANPQFSSGGMVSYGCKILKREGVSGLSKGINPMIMKQVPYTITKNVSFDILTKFFYSTMRAQGMMITATTAFTVPFVSAAIASVLSCISSQPGDMVLSVVNAGEGGRSSREIFRTILESDKGIGGLFVGFKTRMLHVGVIVTLQLLIYDYVKRLAGIAATGSM
jgi:solute carrier family 25 phosphate transporter 3